MSGPEGMSLEEQMMYSNVSRWDLSNVGKEESGLIKSPFSR